MHIAKRSARGSAILFGGNLVATAIAFVASAIVARLLSPSQFGLYSLALVTPSFLQLFTQLGVRTAVTRYVAYHLATREAEKARRFTQSATIFSLVAGAVFALVNYLAAPQAVGEKNPEQTCLMKAPHPLSVIQPSGASVFSDAFCVARSNPWSTTSHALTSHLDSCPLIYPKGGV